jgi:predicted deacylase
LANRIDIVPLNGVADPAPRLIEIVGPRPGPRIALLGGVHGDEDEGVLSVLRVVSVLRDQPIAGTVRAIAMANPAACATNTRCSPLDGQNLARVFPGRPTGSATEQVAFALTERVLKGTQALIDLHSAGRDLAMPLFCGYHAGELGSGGGSAAMARAFGAPLTWAHLSLAEGRSLSAARALGIPAIYAEASGGGEVRGAQTDAFVEGVLNVLRLLGILEEPVHATSSRLIRDPGGDLDAGLLAPATGTWVTRSKAGTIVDTNDVLAEIYNDEGRCIATITAPRVGIVMMLRRHSRVAAGMSVAMVAAAPEPWV